MLTATVVSAPCTMSQWLTVLPGVIQTAAYSECDGLETLGNPTLDHFILCSEPFRDPSAERTNCLACMLFSALYFTGLPRVLTG